MERNINTANWSTVSDKETRELKIDGIRYSDKDHIILDWYRRYPIWEETGQGVCTAYNAIKTNSAGQVYLERQYKRVVGPDNDWEQEEHNIELYSSLSTCYDVLLAIEEDLVDTFGVDDDYAWDEYEDEDEDDCDNYWASVYTDDPYALNTHRLPDKEFFLADRKEEGSSSDGFTYIIDLFFKGDNGIPNLNYYKG